MFELGVTLHIKQLSSLRHYEKSQLLFLHNIQLVVVDFSYENGAGLTNSKYNYVYKTRKFILLFLRMFLMRFLFFVV